MINVIDFKPVTVVFNVVREICLWFGIEDDKIPYFRTDAEVRELDTAAISKM
jgi:hypothetical protein